MIQDVDPGTRVESSKEQDGTKRSPMKPARTPDAGHKCEDGGSNHRNDAEFVAVQAAQ
jgi:hypothetical protein